MNDYIILIDGQVVRIGRVCTAHHLILKGRTVAITLVILCPIINEHIRLEVCFSLRW